MLGQIFIYFCENIKIFLKSIYKLISGLQALPKARTRADVLNELELELMQKNNMYNPFTTNRHFFEIRKREKILL